MQAPQLPQLKEGDKVGDFAVTKKLGEGGFGAVYQCTDNSGQLYALKVESAAIEMQMLKLEVAVLLELNNEENKAKARHFCQIFGRGQVQNMNYVVMTLVGKSLESLRTTAVDGRFSLGTALSIGMQSLNAISELHAIGYLHRDIKPDNFTVGRALMREERKVYLLDFGMARKFIKNDGTLRNPRNLAGFRGTLKYAPIACHIQREQCRKDDMESWLYMLVELIRGRLPWRNIKEPVEVGKLKRVCKAEKQKQLFAGCPRQFLEVFPILDKGKFFDVPAYNEITDLLRQALDTCQVKEFPYDWET